MYQSMNMHGLAEDVSANSFRAAYYEELCPKTITLSEKVPPPCLKSTFVLATWGDICKRWDPENTV